MASERSWYKIDIVTVNDTQKWGSKLRNSLYETVAVSIVTKIPLIRCHEEC
jgi:hypothetical protein